jgi:peroxiredoxin
VWERTYQAWKGKGIDFLGVGLLDSKDAVTGFVRKHGLTFPNGYDGDGRIAKLYGFTYQPFWAVIDRQGMLLRASYGPSGEQELLSTIRMLTGR